MNKAKYCYRYNLVGKSIGKPVSVNDSYKLYDFLMKSVYNRDTLEVFESFYAVFVDRSLSVRGFLKIGEGGVDGVAVDPKIIFSAALKCLAGGIYITHNHTSQNTKPSQIDKDLTKQVVAAGKLLNIQVIDHLIVNKNGYYSFVQNGLMP